MRSRAALIVGCVAALCAAAAGTTRAMWTTGGVVDAGTLRAGRLSLLVGTDGSLVEAYTFTALSGTNLGPGAVRQAPLRVANDGDIALRYRLASTDLGALAGQATVATTRVADEAACPPAGPPTDLGGDVTVPRVLPPAGAEVWCIRVTLGASPPQGIAATPVVFHFAAVQDRHAG